MPLWKLDKSALPGAVGANTKAGVLAGGQPFLADRFLSKRNIILTKVGWIRRQIKKDVAGNVRLIDEVLVHANPGAGLTYASNTHMRYPTISDVYVSSNSTGGTALVRSAVANVYLVFNQAIRFGGTVKCKLLLANSAGGNTMRAVSSNTNSNTTIINANNTLVFPFKPGVAGFYKIAAQTLANSATGILSIYSYNTGAAANLVLTGAVSNTAARRLVANTFYTFSVRTATTGG